MAFLGRSTPESTVIEETTSINSRNADILDKREENQVNDNINDLNNKISDSNLTREITAYGLMFGSKASLLCNFGDLPSWCQDNRDILRGIVTICVAVLPRFRSPHYRWFRTGLFLAMGLSAIVPLAHGIALYGVHFSMEQGTFIRHLVCSTNVFAEY
ncbi:11773_t:CDS:2 [Dentiscutata erythropus]|uniref:11773_t:CDS:1 n=1 Tax=Dentiscutata erythropus TaxID=1348616 RepID=A0A9N8ZAE2_9GLOM|nr:11773_t:CDS:2 [Dentiscutata erythropus]